MYSGDKAFLYVQGGALLDPESLSTISGVEEPEELESELGIEDSTLSYLGTTISTEVPIILIEDDAISGSEDLTFSIEEKEGVTIQIINSSCELVRTLKMSEDDAAQGENTISWDGKDDSDNEVSDGLYYYAVKTDSGEFGKTPATEEVSGIKYVNGTQYLVLDDTKRLAALSSITEVNN